MPRHFYLHTPATRADIDQHKKGVPVACVAYTASIQEPGAATICFAIASYNLNDIGILPFSKNTARNRAIGRLNSPRFAHVITIPVTDTEAQELEAPYMTKRIMHAICFCIAHGTWKIIHPQADSAHVGALNWLAHRAQLEAAVNTPDPEPDRDQGDEQPATPPEEVRAALTMPEASGFEPIATMYCDPSRDNEHTQDGPMPTLGGEPVIFTAPDSPDDAVEVHMSEETRSALDGFGFVVDLPTEDAVDIIIESPETADAIDRIFTLDRPVADAIEPLIQQLPVAEQPTRDEIASQAIDEMEALDRIFGPPHTHYEVE